MVETFMLWLQAYGYPVLAVLLGVGVLGLPIPDETLLVFAGILARSGTLELPQALGSAVIGSWCGITVSYLIGRVAGRRSLVLIVRRFASSRRPLRLARSWYRAYGGWALTFGYFVPGVRHFTAISVGSMAMPWPWFILFAYSGGLVWAVLFVLVGYFGGDQWLSASTYFHQTALIATGIGLMILAFVLAARGRRKPPRRD